MPAHLPVRPIGAHVRIAGGLATGGLAYAEAIGAEVIQVFLANPRGWALPAGDPRQDVALRQHMARTGLPVFVHAPYLVNLGSPDPATRERSSESLAHSLRRAREIGARDVVVHTGSAVSTDREEGLRRVREGLLPLLDSLADEGPGLLLEPMAGQGRTLCGRIEEIGPFLAALDWHPQAGICLDTCHAFAAGHDLAAPQGVREALSLLAAALEPAAGAAGRGRLRLIHANDSKDACGSRRDRHERIGAGQIGMPAFQALLHDPATTGVPFILETPGGRDAVAADVAVLKWARENRAPVAGPAGRS